MHLDSCFPRHLVSAVRGFDAARNAQLQLLQCGLRRSGCYSGASQGAFILDVDMFRRFQRGGDIGDRATQLAKLTILILSPAPNIVANQPLQVIVFLIHRFGFDRRKTIKMFSFCIVELKGAA
jgi:hypothetical protein